MTGKRIEVTVHIDCPREEAFMAWASADALARWFAPKSSLRPVVQMDFVVDGRYSIVMPRADGTVHTTAGRFQEIMLNKKIMMTWRCDVFEDPESVVTVTFDDSDGGTDLCLIHETFASEDTCNAHRGGWDECLGELVNQLNS